MTDVTRGHVDHQQAQRFVLLWLPTEAIFYEVSWQQSWIWHVIPPSIHCEYDQRGCVTLDKMNLLIQEQQSSSETKSLKEGSSATEISKMSKAENLTWWDVGSNATQLHEIIKTAEWLLTLNACHLGVEANLSQYIQWQNLIHNWSYKVTDR